MNTDYILAELTTTYNRSVTSDKMIKVSNSKQIADLFRLTWNNDTIDYVETFKVMFLNQANKVLGIQTIATGAMAGEAADLRVVFASALICGATSIVICHNHPSGQLLASKADKEITNSFRDAGILLNIPVLDHIILTDISFLSFVDEYLM